MNFKWFNINNYSEIFDNNEDLFNIYWIIIKYIRVNDEEGNNPKKVIFTVYSGTTITKDSKHHEILYAPPFFTGYYNYDIKIFEGIILLNDYEISSADTLFYNIRVENHKCKKKNQI